MTTFRKQWRRRRCWPEEPPGGLHSPSKVVARGAPPTTSLQADLNDVQVRPRVVVVCALAFLLMIPWEISRRNPAIDLRMIATRQFAACFLVMLATGALLFGTTQYLPQLWCSRILPIPPPGPASSPGGVVTMVMMFVAGRMSGKVQPKYLIFLPFPDFPSARCPFLKPHPPVRRLSSYP
jgi:hypothetical protein